MEFDIYYPRDPDEFERELRIGATIELDGIDGFFDQYFDARSPGEVIHFIPTFPTNRTDLDLILLVEARITSSDLISGTVVVDSISPFVSWMTNLPADALSDRDPYDEVDALLTLIPEYQTHEPFFWLRPQEERSHRRRTEVNALLGIPISNEVRIAAFTSNATSSLILNRKTQGEQPGDGKPDPASS